LIETCVDVDDKFVLVPVVTTTCTADTTTPPVLDMHTCELKAYVTMNDWLQNVVLEETTPPNSGSAKFDIWIHTQMLLSGYNRS
jgi:hypothetical protein